MSEEPPAARERTREVGPVLTRGRIADAVVQAIRAQNAEVHVEPHPGYLRVLVPDRCQVSALAIGQALGSAFVLPRDLELIMPSFKGRLRIDRQCVTWEAAPR